MASQVGEKTTITIYVGPKTPSVNSNIHWDKFAPIDQERMPLMSGLGSSSSKPAPWTQFVACIAGSMNLFVGSIMIFFTGITLPEMMSPDDSHKILLDGKQASIFSSIIQLGGIIGSLLSGPAMTIMGQRVTTIICIPFGIIGWIVMSQTTNFAMLVTMRGLHGIIHGIILPCGYNYIVEISQPSIRGRLMVVAGLVGLIGNIFLFALGNTSLGWRNLALICGALPFLVPLALFILLPSSPRWLSTRDRFWEARDSLVYFRGKSHGVNHELQAIREDIMKNKRGRPFCAQINLFSEKSLARRLVTLVLFSFFYYFSGHTVILSYVATIFHSLQIGIDEYKVSALFIFIGFVGSCISLLLVDKFGRKPTIIISLFISGVCLIIFAFFVKLQEFYQDLSHLSWVPVLTLCVFNLFTFICYPVTMILPSELSPNSLRPIITGVISVVCYFSAFLAVFSYDYLLDAVGTHWTYLFYALNSFVSILIIGFGVPETKGKSLEEIEAYFT